jgi:guanidinoacetate N-methyltransferase
MTKRLKRTRDYELSLVITNDDFIRPPKDSQRNASLNRLMNEFAENLEITNQVTGEFVEGKTVQFVEDRTNTDLADVEIMEDWQVPLMESMADIVCEGGGDVLEIGFGRGIASGMIQSRKPKSHTIIECNPSVLKRFEDWKSDYSGSKINLVQGLWQETIENLGKFDGVFFHTYPLNQDEYSEYVVRGSTFAEHFFETASAHLVEGGVFTYLTNEIDSLSRAHQRALFKVFSRFEANVVGLDLPHDVADTWWSNSMVVVKAIK